MGTREKWEGGKLERWEGGPKVVSVDLEADDQVSIRAANSGARSWYAIQDAGECGIISSPFQHVCSHSLHTWLLSHWLCEASSFFLVVLVCMLAAIDFICSVLRTACTVFAALGRYRTPDMMEGRASGIQVVEICLSLVASKLICRSEVVSPPWARSHHAHRQIRQIEPVPNFPGRHLDENFGTPSWCGYGGRSHGNALCLGHWVKSSSPRMNHDHIMDETSMRGGVARPQAMLP